MPERIQLSRTKGWRKPEGAITVARSTIWGNPWRIGQPATMLLSGVHYRVLIGMDQLDAVITYREWLVNDRIIGPALPDLGIFRDGGSALRASIARSRQVILDSLPRLRGHDLCCWCRPGTDCHADILLEIANG